MEPSQTEPRKIAEDTPTRLRWIDGTFVECTITLFGHIMQKLIVGYIKLPITSNAKNNYSPPANEEIRSFLLHEEDRGGAYGLRRYSARRTFLMRICTCHCMRRSIKRQEDGIADLECLHSPIDGAGNGDVLRGIQWG